MGRNFSPRGRIERREQQGDMSLFSGVVDTQSKIKSTPPGEHGSDRKKLSEYGKQFRAKQLAKRTYGLLEKQFRNYFMKASTKSGPTGETLLRMLESRLDNVVFRLGFAKTRKEARQMVSHRSIEIIFKNGNSRIVNIPSFTVKPGDTIVIREKCRQQGRLAESIEISKQRPRPEWLSVEAESFRGTIMRLPERNEMPLEINEQLIVELYSK